MSSSWEIDYTRTLFYSLIYNNNTSSSSSSHTCTVQNEEQENIQRCVAENVNQRLEKAMDELKEKHRHGTNNEQDDDPDRAPTGQAYRRIHQQQQQQQTLQQRQKQQMMERELMDRERGQKHHDLTEQIQKNAREEKFDSDCDDNDNDSDLDDWLDECDDDPVLTALREKRLQELKQTQLKRAQDLARGHGPERLRNMLRYIFITTILNDAKLWTII